MVSSGIAHLLIDYAPRLQLAVKLDGQAEDVSWGGMSLINLQLHCMGLNSKLAVHLTN